MFYNFSGLISLKGKIRFITCLVLGSVLTPKAQETLVLLRDGAGTSCN